MPDPGHRRRAGSPRWARPPPALVPRDADERLARIVLEAAGTAGGRDEGARPRRAPARRRARPGPLRRHRRRRPLRHRPDHARPRHRRQRQRRHRLTGAAGAARPRRAGAPRPRRRPRRATPTPLVVSTAVREDNPEYVEARRAGLRLLPRSAGAGLGDGRPPGAGRGRHPRQDHHDRRCSPSPCRRPGPTRRTPWAATSPRPARNAEEGTGDVLRGRGRRERRRVPRLPPARRDRDQRRGRPPRQLGHRGGLPRGLRRVRRPPRPAADGGFLVCVRRRRRGRRPRRARPGPRGVAVVGVGESADADLRAIGPALRRQHLDVHRARRRDASWARSRCRSPGATTSSTRWPRSRSGSASGTPSTRCAGASRASPAPGGGWSARARSAGVRVYDSYAHHPVEIAGDLQAARAVAGEGRVVVALPAAPGLAHPDLRHRDGRARSARPTRSWCWTSTSPARTPTPRSPAPSSRTPARCPRSGSPSSPTSTPSPPSSSPAPAPATWCSPSAPAP